MKLENAEIRKLIDKSHNVIADFIFEADNSNEKIKVIVIMSENYMNDNTDYKNIIEKDLSVLSKSELESVGYKVFYANSEKGVESLKIWSEENNIQ